MDITGAFSFVALQPDWDIHPKNIIPGTATTLFAAAILASIRQRPIITMHTRAASTFDREMYKIEKERFEQFDQAERNLHAAIVESPGHS
jgi:hypothetical protein